jgi:cell division protein FtsI (penicillin-binding protein 3)
VLDARLADRLTSMLESVIVEGTGESARIPGYRVAGKTGTAHKAVAGGYDEHSYTAVFGGLVPVSDPRLAIVAVVQEPSNGKFYGGDVAAPVFAEVAAGALRILGIAPDDLPPPAGDDVESPRLVQAMRTP